MPDRLVPQHVSTGILPSGNAAVVEGEQAQVSFGAGGASGRYSIAADEVPVGTVGIQKGHERVQTRLARGVDGSELAGPRPEALVEAHGVERPEAEQVDAV